VEQKDNQNSLK